MMTENGGTVTMIGATKGATTIGGTDLADSFLSLHKDELCSLVNAEQGL